MHYAKAHREAAGLRVEDVASRSGLGWRTIKRAEAGDNVQMETLVAIAKAIGIPFRDIFFPPNSRKKVRA
jgi:transcriptional regulator with XRE-family HTH domain